jgi:AbrB family looped-hinge helix DNA binding protein
MTRRKVGPKGQVVIPKQVRDELGIEPGDEVVVESQDGEARIRRAVPVDELLGLLPNGPGTAELEVEHRLELDREEGKYERWRRRDRRRRG